VKKLEGQEVSARVVALSHELQHVVDHHSGDGNLRGALEDGDPWMHRVRSEWHAHAMQAKQALELKQAGQKIADRDELLLKSWGKPSFKVGAKDQPQSMFAITKSYMALYGPTKSLPDDNAVTAFINKRADWVDETFAILPDDAVTKATAGKKTP
jgi:hypothetical protein